ncbi:MAG: NUDIX hydrolase [Caulobacteraceae bacterium]
MTEQAFDSVAEDSPSPPRLGRTVRPRDAATLVLVRGGKVDPKVLMGRRHGGHDFMPGKWVFPGGRVDRGDFTAPSASELRPDVAALLSAGTPARRARAIALAAIRETFEEVGLLLARPAPPRLGAGPWRDFLHLGAAPDLAALDFIARAITPPMSPKRFDARFFMADATRLLRQEPLADCGELDEIAWFSLNDALELDLPSVTRFVLRDLPARLADRTRSAPCLRYVRGKQSVTHI